MEMVYMHLIILSAIIVSLFIIAWILSAICIYRDKIRKKIKEINDYALMRAFDRFAIWYKSAIIWMIAEYVFVIVPFVSNVIVIYLTNTENSNTELILLHSIISLAFIVFGYAINPLRHKKAYRKAFRCLDNSINEYLIAVESNNTNSAILDKGIKDGEGFIDESYDIE